MNDFVKENLSEQKNVSNLYNELKDYLKKYRPREYKEIQSEAVAYIAMQNIGVDTSDYSLGYVATWAQNKDITVNLLTQAKATYQEMSKLSGDDNDLYFWADDYKN